MKYVMGIDVGSSSTKVGVFTLEGRLVTMASRGYAIHEPRPGWKEQDPDVWWNSVVDAIRQAGSGIDTSQILAIGCIGHICSQTFVDREGRPLRASFGFQDQRAFTEAEELSSLISREDLAAHLGIDLPPSPTWPLPRLLWFQENEPEILENAHYLLQPKDVVNFRLTGEFATDASSNRGMVNLATGREAEEILSRLGLPAHLLPPLYEPEQVIGRVSKVASAATKLPVGAPVMAGWNDLNASVLGSGAVTAGDAFDVTGSSEHVGVVTSSRHSVPELMYAPFLPGRNLFYGVTSNGGAALVWYCKTFGLDIEKAVHTAESVPAGSDSLFFLPYLDGERAPIWDSRAAGAFVGIRSHHMQKHFGRAVLEGVAFSLLQILNLVEREAGELAAPIIISGGAARIRLWNEIKANVWGSPVIVPEHAHTGVFGAAMLAATGAGIYASCDAAVHGMVRMAERPSLIPDLPDLYRKIYVRFCELYPSLRNHFSQVYEENIEQKESVCPAKLR